MSDHDPHFEVISTLEVLQPANESSISKSIQSANDIALPTEILSQPVIPGRILGDIYWLVPEDISPSAVSHINKFNFEKLRFMKISKELFSEIEPNYRSQ